MPLALLGVELHAKHIVIPDTRNKARAVVSRRSDDGIAQGLHITRVREVEISTRRDAIENRRGASDVSLIPAHMRDFEHLSMGIGKAVRKSSHTPLHQVHPLMAAKFLAFGEQQ